MIIAANNIKPNLLVPEEWSDILTFKIFNNENNGIDNINSPNDTLYITVIVKL